MVIPWPRVVTPPQPKWGGPYGSFDDAPWRRCMAWQGLRPLPAPRVLPWHVIKALNASYLRDSALSAGVKHAEDRKVVEFEPGDSMADKALYVYRLLVHDKLLAPLPETQVSQKAIRHRLALWHARSLPKDDPLLK